MNGAGQKIGPVALEERLVGIVAAAHRPCEAIERSIPQSDMYLFGAVFRSLGNEPKLLEGSGATLRRAIPV